MRYQVLSIPAHGDAEAQAELDRFLASRRIVHVESHLVEAGPNSYWSFCVGYLVAERPKAKPTFKRNQVDYKEVLNPDDFAVFSQLRELRRDLAKRDAVPPYQVFTNEQLASLVTRKVTTKSALASLEGVGPSRLDKYAVPFLRFLKERFQPETSEPEMSGEVSHSDEA
ncbi:MAG: hypothetical protein DWQ01_19505 [Planctomycetota bacterium]|nr:MAG: hypothetical protein DWQ01_19505 [Planctomycetota bacterium]